MWSMVVGHTCGIWSQIIHADLGKAQEKEKLELKELLIINYKIINYNEWN